MKAPGYVQSGKFQQNSGAAGLKRWLNTSGLPTEAAGGAVHVFKELAGQCGTWDRIGRALLWFLFCFPQLEMEEEVSSGLRQAAMGKCIGPYAVRSTEPGLIFHCPWMTVLPLRSLH